MRIAHRRTVMTVAIAAGVSATLLGCGPAGHGDGAGTGGTASERGGTTGSAGSAGTDGSGHGGTTGSAATGGSAGTSSAAGTTGTAGSSAGAGGSAGGAAGSSAGSGGAIGNGGAGAAGNGGRGGAAGTSNGGRGGAGGRGGNGGGSAGTGGATGRGGSGGGSAGTGGGGQSCAGSTLTAGNSNKTISVGGVNRTYIVHVPTSYTGTKPVPLVIDFHALGGSGSQEQSLSGYQAIADREGFPILFPDGIDNAWNIGPCCTNSRTVDDLGFAKAMVATIVAQACIDTKRVYATGFSMGGGMSHYLACNAADIFAAVQPSSFDLLVPDEEPCAPARPISVLTYRGTADTTVPYAGGKGPSGKVTFLGAQGSFQRWVGLDGCVTPTTTDGDCTYYKTCTAGVEVGLCVKQGGGHAPGDANVGWSFLSRFSLP